VSGVAQRFSLPPVEARTLYSGDYSFKMVVPEGTAQLRVELKSDNPSVDADLFLRYNADTDIIDGDVAADHRSEGVTGNETIVVSGSSTPPLRAGTYFVSIGLFSKGVASTGTITATLESAATEESVTTLSRKSEENFSLQRAFKPSEKSGGAKFSLRGLSSPQGAEAPRKLKLTPRRGIR
jgi:hypothetical protein